MDTCMIKIPDTVSVAIMVLAGKYGNGDERRVKLSSEGYNYTKVQSCVNELIKLFNNYKS